MSLKFGLSESIIVFSLSWEWKGSIVILCCKKCYRQKLLNWVICILQITFNCDFRETSLNVNQWLLQLHYTIIKKLVLTGLRLWSDDTAAMCYQWTPLCVTRHQHLKNLDSVCRGLIWSSPGWQHPGKLIQNLHPDLLLNGLLANLAILIVSIFY